MEQILPNVRDHRSRISACFTVLTFADQKEEYPHPVLIVVLFNDKLLFFLVGVPLRKQVGGMRHVLSCI